MDIQEFILLDKAKVRRDSNLMSLYLQFFESTFNSRPNCAGCSFGTDWNKLVTYYSKNKEKSVTLQKQKVMNTISIKKIKGVILAYKKDGKTYRSYDNILSQVFIDGYLSNGTEEELAERKKMFNFPIEESDGTEGIVYRKTIEEADEEIKSLNADLPVEVTFEIDTSKAESKIEDLKNTLNENSTEEEISKGIESAINLIEVKEIPNTTSKPKQRRKRK